MRPSSPSFLSPYSFWHTSLTGNSSRRRIYRLDPRRTTPAHTLRDNIDYVPTRIPILFGHHFASIAGLGPILGPAIAVIWGWGPAVLWVVVGSIFIGAVHDLGALTVSLALPGPLDRRSLQSTDGPSCPVAGPVDHLLHDVAGDGGVLQRHLRPVC